MPYDINIAEERFFHDVETHVRRRNDQPPSRDLEAIVTLLEVAALSLTSEPGAVFTLEELLRQARNVAGSEVEIDERDVKIVLQKARFIETVAGGYRLK